MSEKKPTLITIGEQKYDYSLLTQEQQALFTHCVDLDRKINNTSFQLNQLKVGKDAFYSMLKQSLEVKIADIKQELTE